MGRHRNDDPRETGHQLEERRAADRREEAGLPREPIVADDVARHPGEGDYD